MSIASGKDNDSGKISRDFTTWPQRSAMTTWLEIPENFNLIEGKAQSKLL